MRCRAVALYGVNLILLIVALETPAFGAGSDSAGNRPIILSDLEGLAHHGVHYVESVGEISHGQLISAGTILGITGVLLITDEPVKTIASRNHSSFSDNLFRVTEQYGATGTGLILCGSVYGAGLLLGEGEVRKTGIMMFETLIWSGLVTDFLKSALGRSRPYMDEGSLTFHPFQFKAGTTSLPSGHTTVAFALSSVLSERINNRAISVGLYSLAGLTAFARIYHNVHWFSDTFLGAAVGTVAGIAIVRFNDEEYHHSGNELYLIPGGVALAFHL